MKKSITRRTVLKTLGAAGAAAAGAAASFPFLVRASALGSKGVPAASDRITMACIGIGVQGRGDMQTFLHSPQVRVLGVCDVNRNHLQQAKSIVDARYGNADCAATTDFRDLVARRDIDAVMVAVPDHWHALIAIAACRQGKDVFCEKPLSLTVREGRAMVQAARRNDRVVSSGSQRVRGDYGQLADYVASGAIGEIKQIYVNHGPPSRPCPLPGEPVPDWLDYEMWLGPAPWQPFHPGRVAGYTAPVRWQGMECQWRAWQDFSGGGMTDWGAHNFGGAMYGAQLDSTGPVEILPPDGRNVPWLTYVFANGIRMCHGGPVSDSIHYVGTAGQAGGGPTPPHGPSPLRQYHDTQSIFQDFLNCVRTRQRPFQDFEYAHRVATVCHLGNIAYGLKRPLKFDPAREVFVGDDEANRMLDRPRREPWRL